MIKLFVSYSHRNESIVHSIVEIVGRDRVFLDDYSFAPAKSIDDSVKEQINASSIFVLFMSNDALDSPWVGDERRFVRDYVDDGTIIYCPIIIDEEINVSDSRIEKWEKGYLLVVSNSPKTIARIIQNRISDYTFRKSKGRNELPFVGRDADLTSIEEKAFAQISNQPRALIVSGWPKIGRKRLLQEFICQKIYNGARNEFSPIRITLSPNDSVEDFIAYLNDSVELYSDIERINRSKTKDGARDTAVSLLNKLCNNREKLLIDDEKCIVTVLGRVVDWFYDIIRSPLLSSQIHFFVASRYSVKDDLIDRNLIVSHRLDALDKKHMVTLFNRYGISKGIECDPETVDEFVSQLTYPEQIRLVVDIIKNKDVPSARKSMDNIKMAFDKNARQFFDGHNGDRDLIQMVNLLSRTDFLSYPVLVEFFSSEVVDRVLEELDNYGLLNRFGSYNQYISLDRTLSDYVSRKNISYAKDVEKTMNEISSRLLRGFSIDELDLSEQLMSIRQLIISGKGEEWSRYLLPSYALRVLVDEYNKEHYQVVISISNRILQGYQTQYYDSVIRSMRYWKCLSLCRESDPDALTEAEYFNNSTRNGGYSYNFLKGFYFRNSGNPDKALLFYNRALANKVDADLPAMSYSKAEHEKVIVLMKLGRFGDALALAKKNYENHPDNPYNVDAYFRCYVKSDDPDKAILQRLMTEMDAFETRESDTLKKVFRAEYAYYIENDYDTAYSILAPLDENRNTRSRSIASGSLQEIMNREKKSF